MPRYRNVLLLCSDEHDPRHSGFMGSPVVQTPHLDRLAARGAVFTRAYTPSPICVPARASLATGRWVHDHRCWDNAIAYDGRQPSWAHRLHQGGVGVESIGKLHYRSAADDTGFERQREAVHIAGDGQVWGCVRDPLPERSEGAGLFKRIGAGESEYNRFDRRVADGAIDWLQTRAAHTPEQRDAQPALLFAGFVAPHFPLVVPQVWLDLYPPDQVPWPKLRAETGYQRHPWVQRQADFNHLDAQLEDDQRRRLAIASYFGLVSFIDAQIGRVLQALEDLGLADETLVVYTSDHGDNLGARGMWNKSTLYREATNVPMIVAGPGLPTGRVCSTNVNLIDVAPTITEAAGLRTPAEWPGRSLRAIAHEADDAQRVGFSEYHAVGSPSAAFMLRQGRWAYHHYVGYAPELFDIENDPGQAEDLAARPAHANDLGRLEALLRQWVDPEAVDRRAKVDQDALVARFGGREAALQVGPPGASPVP